MNNHKLKLPQSEYFLWLELPVPNQFLMQQEKQHEENLVTVVETDDEESSRVIILEM
jgi:hypothetical protein